MEKRRPIPAPITKGVNFTNWLEYRPAEEIDADYMTEQDFKNAAKLGCDVIRLPIHFEKLCKKADGYRIPEKILKILDNAVRWSGAEKMYLMLHRGLEDAGRHRHDPHPRVDRARDPV